MKKWILRAVLGIVVLFVLAMIVVVVCLDTIVKKGVETAGPMITKVDVKLDGAHLSIFSGSADLKGLLVGNPPDYTTPSAMKVGEVSVSLKPMSVFSDKVIIDTINVKSPEITFEGGLRNNNLSKIESNINGSAASSSGGGAASTNSSAKKIQVGDLLISGATMHVKSSLLGGQTLSVTLPDIHLTNLGTGSDGITPAELSNKIMNALMQEVIPAITKMAANAGANALKLGKGAEQQGQNAVKSGLNSLLGH